MIDVAIRRVLPLGCLALVLAFIARGQFMPHVAADTWFHLRIGREFVDGWSISAPGNLGVYDSADWIPTQWLSQMGMAQLESLGGIAAVIWISGTLAMLVTILVYTACRPAASPLPAAVATTLSVAAAWPGLSARPQMLSYLFVVLTLMGWLSTFRDGRPRWWLVAIAWIWPMAHGMWLVGLSISVVAVAGMLLDRQLTPREWTRMAFIPVLSLAVSVMNPLAFDTLRGIFVVGSRTRYFDEWGPPDFTAPFGLILLGMLALVIVTNVRAGQMRWAEIGLVLLALGWGAYSMRTTPVGALLIAPFVAAAIQRFMPFAVIDLGRERIALPAMLLVGALGMALVAGQRADTSVVPTWVDSRLDALPDGARLLDEWSPGSYLTWRHPDLDVVMHGYGDLFTDQEIERNADISRLEPGWDRLVDEVDADHALVSPHSALGYALITIEGWHVVQEDDEYAFLTPPG